MPGSPRSAPGSGPNRPPIPGRPLRAIPCRRGRSKAFRTCGRQKMLLPDRIRILRTSVLNKSHSSWRDMVDHTYCIYNLFDLLPIGHALLLET
jgi:hypothetical protein